MAEAGIVLSHAHRVHIASNMCPRPTSSMESAMTSRLTSEVFMPSVPIVIPSEMAIVLNSIGLAPAALMPAFKGLARSRSPKLHGIVSVQTFETPTNGLSMSALVSPIAWRNDRAAARSRPSYRVRLGSAREGTAEKSSPANALISLPPDAMKVLVTGVAGYLGALATARLLREGHAVR